MEHYYLAELNYEELRQYNKKHALTRYKVTIKEQTSEYSVNLQIPPPNFELGGNLADKGFHQPTIKKRKESCRDISFYAMGNCDIPIDLRFVKNDRKRKSMLQLKINPYKKDIEITTLEWNDEVQSFVGRTDGNDPSERHRLLEPAIKSLLQRIYIEMEERIDYLILPFGWDM